MRIPGVKFVLTVLAGLALLILAAPALRAGEADDLLSRADEVYRGRADLTKAVEAAALYRQALSVDPGRYQAAWKLTRCLIWITEHSRRKEDKLAAAREAVEVGRQAVALDPENAEGHFWLGMAITFHAEVKGVIYSLNALPEVKKEMDFVIARDPGYLGGGAHMLLGRISYLVPGLLGGSNREAIRQLETALKYGPRQWNNHVYLAEVYIDVGRTEEARRLLLQILAGPADPDVLPEYDEVRHKAERLLEKIGG